MISSTVARTSRLMTPIGISESVTTGRIRCLICSQLAGKPGGPMPCAGSVFQITAKIATSTMPTQ